MWQNIVWILEYEGHDSKVMFWAHNDHIGSETLNGLADGVGHHLKKQFGNAYYNIHTDFGSGNFLAYPHDAGNGKGWILEVFKFDNPNSKTFTFEMKQQGGPNTFVDLKQAKQDKNVKCMLTESFLVMSGAGAQYRNVDSWHKPIGESFDAVIYLDKTHKVTMLKDHSN
jgi:erythromycin esterase-like protein